MHVLIPDISNTKVPAHNPNAFKQVRCLISRITSIQQDLFSQVDGIVRDKSSELQEQVFTYDPLVCEESLHWLRVKCINLNQKHS